MIFLRISPVRGQGVIYPFAASPVSALPAVPVAPNSSIFSSFCFLYHVSENSTSSGAALETALGLYSVNIVFNVSYLLIVQSVHHVTFVLCYTVLCDFLANNTT